MKKINLTSLSIILVLFLNGCTNASVESQVEAMPEANESTSTNSILEIENMAGFDIKEPTYLPEQVFFDTATYENQIVTLYFNFGERGGFFHITQVPVNKAIPNPNACGVSSDECETIQVGDIEVNYRVNPPMETPTETLMWEANGFSFQLFRTAGEPNKIYKDELIKVVQSMI